jgi:methanogenic corrinoid protein MtbC1
MAKGWEAGPGPLALLACAPGERHTLGLVCFGLVLAERGWRIAYLGADTPVDQIAAMSASLSPAAVVLCSLAPQSLTAEAGALADLGRDHHTILAGRGVTAALAGGLGAHPGEGDPVTTAQALADHPPPPAPAARRAAR